MKDKKTNAVDGESAKQSAAVAKRKASKSKETDEDKASKKKRIAPSDGESSHAKKSPSKKKVKTKKSAADTQKLEKEEPKKVGVTAHVTKRPREYKGKYADMPSLEAPAKGMPNGWKEMHIPHASKPGYSYTVWYSPDGRRFDTKKGALSFIGFFEQTKDELAAFELFQADQRVKKTSKICKSEGCLKLAQKGGKCIQHGAAVKKCSSAGCTNNAKRRGLCKRHGAYRDETVLTC